MLHQRKRRLIAPLGSDVPQIFESSAGFHTSGALFVYIERRSVKLVFVAERAAGT